MTRGRVVVLATALVAMVAASVAMAAGNDSSTRLSGHVSGDSESIVRLSVVTKDGEPHNATRIRFKKILATCDGVEQRISVKLTGRIPFEKDGTFRRVFGDGSNGFVKVEGQVKRNGGRVVGIVRSRAVAVLGVGVCEIAPSGFKVNAYKVA
jgi:hypothetical protein